MIATDPPLDDAPLKPGTRARVSVTAAAQAQAAPQTTLSAVSSSSVLPVLDLGPFLDRQTPEDRDSLCTAVADALVNTGCLVVRDPRVGADQSETFLDQMERYFSQPTPVKQQDSRPELHYQVPALLTSLSAVSENTLTSKSHCMPVGTCLEETAALLERERE